MFIIILAGRELLKFKQNKIIIERDGEFDSYTQQIDMHSHKTMAWNCSRILKHSKYLLLVMAMVRVGCEEFNIPIERPNNIMCAAFNYI